MKTNAKAGELELAARRVVERGTAAALRARPRGKNARERTRNAELGNPKERLGNQLKVIRTAALNARARKPIKRVRNCRTENVCVLGYNWVCTLTECDQRTLGRTGNWVIRAADNPNWAAGEQRLGTSGRIEAGNPNWESEST